MRYLDIEGKIYYDVENGKIVFSEEPDKSFALKDMMSKRARTVFLMLLEKEGKWCTVTELENALGIASYGEKSPVVAAISEIRKCLNAHEIPCNKGDEKDPAKIIIRNESKTLISGNSGAYILILPKSSKIPKNEKMIMDLYWDRYEELSAQKDSANRFGEIQAKLGDVYQIPLLQELGQNCKWNINNAAPRNKNILIEAPNGYGKTTFLRSILLAATYQYRENLSEKEKEKYEAIKRFHGIEDDSFFLYLECKNIDIESLDGSGNSKTNNIKPDCVKWIYDTLSGFNGILIDQWIKEEDFRNLIESYNLKKKLILLVDGLDELRMDYRTVLIKKLYEFQSDLTYGSGSRIIMTVRPLFWQINFPGYRKYTISNKNIIEDKKVLLNYLKSYDGNYRNFNVEELYEYIISNPYMRELVCTPGIIVWVIKEHQVNEGIWLLVERIIEQMMLRYDPRQFSGNENQIRYCDAMDFVSNIEQYKRVYEEIAYKYLCSTKDDQGLSFYNPDVLRLVQDCIEQIRSENDRKFNRVFPDENEEAKSLGELFFTNVALMECQIDRLKFTSSVYAYHLAARLVLRYLSRKDYKTGVIRMLDEIPAQHRYTVIVLASSLALHTGGVDNRGIRIYNTNGLDKDEIRYVWAEVCCEYMKARWSDIECSTDEKLLIQDAIAKIFLKYYGENVYTNRNMIEDTQKYINWLECAVSQKLEGRSAAVLEVQKRGHGK